MYTLSQYLDNDCTRKEWIDQHTPIMLEVNKAYIQHKGQWCEKHYCILFIDSQIAVGVSIYSAIGDGPRYTGDYELFYVENGFKYQDIARPEYRLTEEKTNINNLR